MRIAVLTECSLSRKHGTGAQLLRLLDGADYFHLYLEYNYAGDSEIEQSHLLGDPRWRGRGKRYALQLERWLGVSWWKNAQLNQRRFDRLRQTHDLSCDVAYVLVADESQAGRFNALLEQLRVPYVVHVMDIYYDDGFDPATMPQLARLFRGAAANLALSDPIAAEIAPFGVDNITLVPIGQDPTPHRAAPPKPGGPIRIVTVGKPYPTGTALLASAWPIIRQRVPNATLVYAGQHTHALPADLSTDLENRGYISDKTIYEQLLADCHIAYLSGPSELDKFGKFSIPSRTSDYLMAGLPIVAAVPDGTATQRFLQPLVPESACTAMNADAIVDAVCGFAGDLARWSVASEHCRRFGMQTVSMEQVRGQVLNRLAAVAAK